jgi:hypothetical protein
MKLKTFEYRGWPVTVEVTTDGLFVGNIPGIGQTPGPIGVNRGYATYGEMIVAAYKMVDMYVASAPATWEELAKRIQETVVWENPVRYSIDPQILKQLVTSFAHKTEIAT